MIGLPIYFDGGLGVDALELDGNPATAVETSTYTPGPENDKGRIVLDDIDGGQLMSVEFAGLEPVVNKVGGRRHIVQGTAARESFVVESVSTHVAGNTLARVKVNGTETYEFDVRKNFRFTNARLTLNGRGGGDTYYLQSDDVLATLPLSVFVQGTGNGEESIVVNGTRNADIVTFSPGTVGSSISTAESGTVRVHISALGASDLDFVLSYDDVSRMTINGAGGVDAFELAGASWDETVTLFGDQTASDVTIGYSSGTTPSLNPRLSVTLKGILPSVFDLGAGNDQVLIVGRDTDDQVTIGDGIVDINGTSLTVSNHELVRVEAGHGSDIVTIIEPTLSGGKLPAIAVNGGAGGDFDLLRFDGSPNLSGDIVLQIDAAGPSEGFLSTPLSPISFSGISQLNVDLNSTNRAVSVIADDGDNSVSVAPRLNVTESVGTSAFITIDERPNLRVDAIGPSASLKLFGQGGDDRFTIDSIFPETTVDGGDSARLDRLILAGTSGNDGFDYLPDAVLPNAGLFGVNGRAIAFQRISDVVISGLNGNDSFSAFGNAGTTSQAFTTPVPMEPESKIFAGAFATNSTGGTDTIVRAVGSDGFTALDGGPDLITGAGVGVRTGNMLTGVNDDSGPLGAGLIAGATIPGEQTHVTFVVGSGDGKTISEFELIGGVVALSEFDVEDEPNNNPIGTVIPIAVQVDSHQRIAQTGQIPAGSSDVDLIAVHVDQDRRIAAIVNNDPDENGEFTQTHLRLLGADGESVLMLGANQQGVPANALLSEALVAGTYYLELSNSALAGESDYEIVVFGIFDAAVQQDGEDYGTSQNGIGYAAPQHGQGSINSTVRNDVVKLTPLGIGDSMLRFNDSSPLSLVGFESVSIDPRDGLDQLKVFGTMNSDTLSFDASTLAVNSQVFGHLNVEAFLAFGNSGDDVFEVASGLNGGLFADGGEGRDLLSVDSNSGPAGLALPGTIIDGRTISSVAVESVALDATGQDVVIAGSPDASSHLAITSLSPNSVRLEAGGLTYDVVTTGTLTIAGAAPSSGSQVPLRSLGVYGTVFDDVVNLSDRVIDLGNKLKPIQLSDVPSVAITGGPGRDTFQVTPSATTSFFIDGGNPIGVGDSLYVTPGSGFFTHHIGPTDDSGGFEVSGMQPISYVHIENTVLANQPVGIQPASPSRNGLPQLAWSPVIDVVSYEVELVNLTLGGPPTLYPSVDSEFQPTGVLPLGHYQFRVQGIFESVERTEFSEPVAFSVRTRSQLLGETINRDGFPEIQWTPVEGATRYDLWINNQTTGESQFLREQFLTDTLFVPESALPIGNYNVWVRPHSANGFAGTWTGSPLRVATTTNILGPVGASINGRPKFEWDPVVGAETYDLWVRQLAPEFTDPIILVKGLSDTFYTSEDSLPEGTFVFWVQPQGANGFRASWSSGVRFQSFGTPVIQGPERAAATTLSPISWTDVNGAASYELEVVDSAGNILVHELGIVTTVFRPSVPFAFGIEHQVRVRAVDTSGASGNWSPTHRFVTPPDRVISIGPGQDVPDTGLPAGAIRFSWNSVVGAARYELWVNQIGGSSRVVHEKLLTDTEFTSQPFSVGKYRFWVRAINSEGRAGVWSAPLEFTVAAIDDAESQLPFQIEDLASLIVHNWETVVQPVADSAQQAISEREASIPATRQSVPAVDPIDSDYEFEIPVLPSAEDLDLAFADWDSIDI